jgi:hypothetical protein
MIGGAKKARGNLKVTSIKVQQRQDYGIHVNMRYRSYGRSILARAVQK